MARLILLSILLVSLAAGQSERKTFAFDPAADTFASSALLDLRHLNEAVAGESGFLSVDGNGDFRKGDGSPLRVWAVNTTVGREKPYVVRPLWRRAEPDLERHARFLAKRGVNMVRLHAHVNPPARTGAGLDAINAAERDWIWRTVAAMKKQGIYTVVSPYWANTMEFNAAWQYPMAANATAHGLLFFDETLQQAFRAWLRALLAETNPYTGIPLARDPALGMIQIQNEDSLLFWTVNNIREPHLTALRKKFTGWVKEKYGSLDGAFAAWQNRGIAGDDRANELLALYNLWDMTDQGRTTQRAAGESQRIADQLEFYTRTMHGFNREMVRYLREDLECGQIVNAGNWKTGDVVRLEDAERYSYTAGEVQAVNRYFTGVHNGPNRSWAIMNNDEYTSPSVLKSPLDFPLALKQTAGYPMMVTESTWVPPMGTAAEAAFLVAAYQSLTGIDAFFWFSTWDDEWTAPQSANGYLASQQKWLFGSPEMLGAFPGAALLYRMGYVEQGAPVVMEERALEDLWKRRTPIIAESASYDPNRDSGDIAPQSAVKTRVDPLAFLAGPVQVVFDGDPARSSTALEGLIREDRREVRAITGQVTLNAELGYCTVNAPKAQGVTAFFENQASFRLQDVEIWSGNRYGAVLVAALDDTPLAASQRVLVQVTMPARPTGWQEEARTLTVSGQQVAGARITNFGRAPWRVEAPEVDVLIRNTGLRRATALDANGNARGEVELVREQDGVRLRFPEDTLYVILRGE